MSTLPLPPSVFALALSATSTPSTSRSALERSICAFAAPAFGLYLRSVTCEALCRLSWSFHSTPPYPLIRLSLPGLPRPASTPVGEAWEELFPTRNCRRNRIMEETVAGEHEEPVQPTPAPSADENIIEERPEFINIGK
ncbi:hypothetical protein BD779DRAFT_1679027 [Infundibulicybe gibba]|nr:hypothetical protein BD779DRAFT_1679027 [Infundibulicybe gibba]